MATAVGATEKAGDDDKQQDNTTVIPRGPLTRAAKRRLDEATRQATVNAR
ncbi:hypothetical protein PC113_g13993 [Phytophthora cactorum]|uniref:Uncharacterized protein n=1 Tax=Phytophthora cactorum TaxID=29920 RepID=A0A8T0YVJ0_9STRA|nr:hypothetical protein PC113_g13993 [Phytophthora cactorum]